MAKAFLDDLVWVECPHLLALALATLWPTSSASLLQAGLDLGASEWVTVSPEMNRTFADGTVSKIVAATGVIAAPITVGDFPIGVAFDGTHIWVVNLGGDTVSKIVAATGAVADTIPVGNDPTGVAFDGTHIWVANLSDDSVSKIPVG